ncbi:hypothetical protein AVEN_46889-1 [Araneus ventricosus]|uniref:Uncharacterized protein n=1 Tax=Araneus ventricosus TaxID=182803 RepID=A0A4Y2CLR6_ARAVE|nr:hypothetical protein AVEN_46889-1 [Araneus ventricosus]
MSAKVVRVMTARFEKTAQLVQPGRGHKSIPQNFVEDAETAVFEQSTGASNTHTVSRQTGIPYKTVHKVFRNKDKKCVTPKRCFRRTNHSDSQSQCFLNRTAVDLS